MSSPNTPLRTEDEEYAYDAGQLDGATKERERILKRMEDYFDLTRYSVVADGAEENPEWDRGYQAAMAIARAERPSLFPPSEVAAVAKALDELAGESK